MSDQFFGPRTGTRMATKAATPVVIPEIAIKRFEDDFHRVVLRVGVDIRDGDDGSYSGVDVLIAQTGGQQDANNDLQGRRLVYPSEQPLEKQTAILFLIAVKTRCHQLAANTL
jgi:hypothetical protein